MAVLAADVLFFFACCLLWGWEGGRDKQISCALAHPGCPEER